MNRTALNPTARRGLPSRGNCSSAAERHRCARRSLPSQLGATSVKQARRAKNGREKHVCGRRDVLPSVHARSVAPSAPSPPPGTCHCTKNRCQTNGCSCFKHGLWCSANCHGGRGSEASKCCKNIAPEDGDVGDDDDGDRGDFHTKTQLFHVKLYRFHVK